MPPDLLDVELHATAQVNRSILFAHAKTLVVFECLVRRAVVPHIFATPLNDDEVLVDLRRRSPVSMVLVAGPGARQSVYRTKLVDGAGFSIVSSPDAGFGALGRRERIVVGRDFTRH